MIFFTKNLKNTRFKKKLFYKFTKLFEIKNIVKLQAYRLCLFNQWKIYFIFHVSFSKLYYINTNIVFFAEMIFMSEDEKCKVKDILKNKKKWKKSYYFVYWKEFPLCKNNWIFKHYLMNAQNMFKCYHKLESFITVMFKTKKLKFRIRKKNLSKEK